MVKLKRKVTLRTKVADTPDSTKPKVKRWLLLVGIIVALVVAFLFLKPDNSDNSVSEEKNVLVSTSESLNGETEDVKGNNAESQPNLSLTEKPQTDTSISKKEDIKTASNHSVEYVEKKALSVIRGNYGNGEERKNKLGTEYQVIQDKVNEMYRKGLVH